MQKELRAAVHAAVPLEAYLILDLFLQCHPDRNSTGDAEHVRATLAVEVRPPLKHVLVQKLGAWAGDQTRVVGAAWRGMAKVGMLSGNSVGKSASANYMYCGGEIELASSAEATPMSTLLTPQWVALQWHHP